MIEKTSPFFFTKIVAEADIDMLNHVNNAVYLQYLQEAAMAHWENRASTELQAELIWIVRRHEIDYLKAAVLGDSLQIKTWVGAYTAATWDRHYEIYNKVNQQLLVKAKSVWVAVDRKSMRVRRIEGPLKDCFLKNQLNKILKMNPEILHPELQFQTARSGGKGGQNVNKVETKVELRFDILNSNILDDEAKVLLQNKLGQKLTTEGILILYHQTERSQLANKEKVIKKFDALIQKCFEKPKPRKASRPTAESKEKRLEAKQRNAAVKAMRRKIIE